MSELHIEKLLNAALSFEETNAGQAPLDDIGGTVWVHIPT